MHGRDGLPGWRIWSRLGKDWSSRYVSHHELLGPLEAEIMASIMKVTQVIVESFADEFLVRCGSCGGNGWDGGKCRVCDGVGKVRLSVPSSWRDADVGLLRCGSCGGNGWDGGRCRVCGGVGVLVKCFPRVVCGACGGNGWDSGRCRICKGVGSIYIKNIRKY